MRALNGEKKTLNSHTNTQKHTNIVYCTCQNELRLKVLNASQIIDNEKPNLTKVVFVLKFLR